MRRSALGATNKCFDDFEPVESHWLARNDHTFRQIYNTNYKLFYNFFIKIVDIMSDY